MRSLDKTRDHYLHDRTAKKSKIFKDIYTLQSEMGDQLSMDFIPPTDRYTIQSMAQNPCNNKVASCFARCPS